MVGMIDAVPGVTCFRVRIGKHLHDMEGSTAVILHHPRLAEEQLVEFIEERRH